jgi:hypothetical protein
MCSGVAFAEGKCCKKKSAKCTKESACCKDKKHCKKECTKETKETKTEEAPKQKS